MEGILFRPAQSPFEVEHIRERIFCQLDYSQLMDCRLVCKEWDAEASRELWKRSVVRRVQCRLMISEEELRPSLILDRTKTFFSMDKDQEFLQLLRSRNPSSRHSFFSFNFDYNLLDLLKLVDPWEYGCWRSLCLSHDRVIEKFLFHPLTRDVVGSVTLGRRFVDLPAVLRILTTLPNLKEVRLHLEMRTCSSNVSNPDQVFLCQAVSPIEKLQLHLVPDISRHGAIKPYLTIKFVSAILRVCGYLQHLEIFDEFRHNFGCDPMQVSLVQFLQRPQRLQTLELQSYPYRPRYYSNIQNVSCLAAFSNLKSLDLLDWDSLPLAGWKRLIADDEDRIISPHLQVLCLAIHEEAWPGADAHAQLLCHHLFQGQGAKLGRLKHLVLRCTFGRDSRNPKLSYDWYEEWNAGRHEALTLTEARIVYDGTSAVDLRSFANLAHLTLRVRRKSLAAALAAAPSSVKHLQITLASPDFILKLKDEELRSAVEQNLQPPSSLRLIQVRQRCSSCSRWTIKYLYLNEPNHRVSHFRLRSLPHSFGSGLSKRVLQHTDGETRLSECCTAHVLASNEIM